MDLSSFHNPLYSLGCPVWNCDSWKGSVYASRARREVWLTQYSQVFSTVEGNSTFYGLPSTETVYGWGQKTSPGFEFCLKFPRTISHEAQLRGADVELKAFCERLEILANAEKLGPSLLQLPPYFSPTQIQDLKQFLEALPKQFPYAVEVRHPNWFETESSQRLNELLGSMKMDRVIFDSRPLYARAPEDETERESQRRKPKLPVEFVATAARPMLRLIGRNHVTQVQPWLGEWTDCVANWISEGRRPIVFTHTPDDANAPEFARMFHNALSEKLSALKIQTLSSFDIWPHQVPIQQELF